MNLYNIDVWIYGTAYIKAKDAAEALAIAKKLAASHIVVNSVNESEIEVSEVAFDSPRMPALSLAPWMTIHGPDDECTVELCDEDVAEGDENAEPPDAENVAPCDPLHGTRMDSADMGEN